jgi:hypothetical protein
MKGDSLRTRLASAVVLLVMVAAGVRVAYALLAPAVPWLVTVGALAAVYLFMLRPPR